MFEATKQKIPSVLSNRQVILSDCFRISFPPKKPLTAGLPQGAVLSPILFTLYTADIPRPPHIQLALFADTAIFTQSWRPDTNPAVSPKRYVDSSATYPAGASK